MTYKVLVNDRKQAVRRMEALTGEKAQYTKMPRSAYILRGITVEKDNTLTATDGEDEEIISTLLAEGLIGEEGAEAVQDDAPAEAEATDADTEAEETATESADETAEDTEAEADETETEDADVEAEQEATEDATEDEADDEPEIEAETEGTSEADGEGAGDPETEDADTEAGGTPEDESTAEETTDTLGASYGEIRDNFSDGIKPSVSFPLENHKAESVRNIVCMLYSKGNLISKATGGTFFASQDLVDAMQAGGILNRDDAVKAISEAGENDLKGVTIEDNKVTFDGFPETTDTDAVQAWTALATAMNATAIRQMHIRAKQMDEENEKYAFRTWLTRLGMNGKDTKQYRTLLYKNLSGHTAFRTPEGQERWTQRQNEKRDALRMLKVAAMEEAASQETDEFGDPVEA